MYHVIALMNQSIFDGSIYDRQSALPAVSRIFSAYAYGWAGVGQYEASYWKKKIVILVFGVLYNIWNCTDILSVIRIYVTGSGSLCYRLRIILYVK
jgi:hypothetical protein